jgi:hypothetical protein
MGGSYSHVVTDHGNLASPDSWYIENLGDAYEAVEEMYGMIWWLANISPRTLDDSRPEELVEMARQKYKEGLELAKVNKNKAKVDD